MIWLALLAAILAGGALLGALATLARTGPPAAVVPARVTLIMAVTGRSIDLARLWAAIRAQTLVPMRVVFAVESRDDPAHAALAALGEGITIHVAGEAASSSQKSHNLASALAAHDDGEAIIAFADADILPRPFWLADLTRPIARGSADLVSGYRWQLPMDAAPASLVSAWIDRALACLPKFRWQVMAWGGSLAFAPGVLKRLDAVALLERSISDDLALAALARNAGLRTHYRLRVLVPSPVAHTPRAFFGFAVRQYQMLKLYQPRVWAMALALVGASFAIKLALWTAALFSTTGLAMLLAFLCANWIAYGMRLRRAMALDCWPVMSRRAEAALCLMPIVSPLIDLVHLVAIVRGGDTRRIDWSHLSYEMNGRNVAKIVRREWM